MGARPTTNDQHPPTGDVAVLVPAAGQGTRLGGRRKQFRTLGGRPLLVQTLLAFEHHPAVDDLIVAVPPEDVQAGEDILRQTGFQKLTAVVGGGTSRQASVRRALRAVPDAVDVVLVHDAVRPFIAAEAITNVIDAVRASGAAALAIPVVDTLRKGSAGTFGSTVSRAGLYRMQTPQGFHRSLFEAAHREAARAGGTATDDVELVQRTGHAVHIVAGSTHNVKITTPEDWALARCFWPYWTENVSG